jgi:urease accessory protein UreH
MSHYVMTRSRHQPMSPLPDARSAAEIGRRARLELVFAYRRGRTMLAHAYAEPPLRVGRLFEAGPAAHMILVCCGPGVFAGDRLEQHVRVERGARVLLTSQSALQIHPPSLKPPRPAVPLRSHSFLANFGETSPKPWRRRGATVEVEPVATSTPATLIASYDIESGGALDCFWDPVIPFAGARLQQRIEVRVAEQGELFWSDALMSGRVARGEAWRFEGIDHELRASIDGSLTYLERYGLDPRSRALAHTWSAHRANYLGTTIVHGDGVTTARAEEAQQRLGAIDALQAGVDCLAAKFLVGRLLAVGGPQFARARAVLRDVFGRPALRRT